MDGCTVSKRVTSPKVQKQAHIPTWCPAVTFEIFTAEIPAITSNRGGESNFLCTAQVTESNQIDPVRLKICLKYDLVKIWIYSKSLSIQTSHFSPLMKVA